MEETEKYNQWESENAEAARDYREPDENYDDPILIPVVPPTEEEIKEINESLKKSLEAIKEYNEQLSIVIKMGEDLQKLIKN